MPPKVPQPAIVCTSCHGQQGIGVIEHSLSFRSRERLFLSAARWQSPRRARTIDASA